MKTNEPRNYDFFALTDHGSSFTKSFLIEKQDSEFILVDTQSSYSRDRELEKSQPISEHPPTSFAPILNNLKLFEKNKFKNKVKEKKIITIKNKVVFNNNLPFGDTHRFQYGLDAHLISSSVAGPLQCLVIGFNHPPLTDEQKNFFQGTGAILIESVEHYQYQKLALTIREMRPESIMMLFETSLKLEAQKNELKLFLSTLQYLIKSEKNYLPSVILAIPSSLQSAIPHGFSKQCKMVVTQPLLGQNSNGVFAGHTQLQNTYFNHHSDIGLTIPQYRDLLTVPPGPSAGNMGLAVQLFYQCGLEARNLIAVDLGKQSTNIYTVYDGSFYRTLKAIFEKDPATRELLSPATLQAMSLSLPPNVSRKKFYDFIANKIIFPDSLPITTEELMMDHALAKFLIAETFALHESILTETICKLGKNKKFFDRKSLPVILATGGALSKAPRPIQAMLMLSESIRPCGLTEYYLDRQQILPALGQLFRDNEDVARNVMTNAFPNLLGTGLRPLPPSKKAFSSWGQKDREIIEIKVKCGQSVYHREIHRGEVVVFPIPSQERAFIQATPVSEINLGAGPGVMLEAEVKGGEVGLLVDTRPCTKNVHRYFDHYESLKVYSHEIILS